MKNTAKPGDLLMFDKNTLEAKNYWLKKLSGKIAPAGLRPDYPGSGTAGEKTGTVEVVLDGETYRGLSKLTGEEPFLLYAVLTAVLHLCMHKYTGATPVLIGSPALKTAEGAARAGNVLAIVMAVDDKLSFRQFLVAVRQALLEDYAYQDYPWQRLVKDLEIGEIGEQENRCPLFDVSLALAELHAPMPETGNRIALSVVRAPGRLTLQVAFNAGLYKTETLEGFTRHYLNLLAAAVENTGTLLADLQVLTPAERHHLLVEWNDTGTAYPRDKCVHQLFEEQVRREGEAKALVYDRGSLTYRELDRQANQVAHYLEKLGVGPDLLVGICMERSLELVISLLGVLKAGGAYVPLDPAYPKERLATMLEDARMLHVLLTKEPLLDRLPGNDLKVVCLDRDRETIRRESTECPVFRSGVHNLVYVIFTSGSTGRAKGAAVYHRGWTNLMNWFSVEFRVVPGDKVLVVSSFSFDITQRSLAMPLINGAQLHLLASEHYDPGLILQTIAQDEITLLNCSPSTFYPLIETTDPQAYQKLHSLRILFLGGEAISGSRLKPWVESGQCRTEIANVYGAAECTDVSSFYRLKDFERYAKFPVPAGKPIFNSQVYILDKNLNPVPMGITGEICLAGAGVGQGYINDEQLTTEKFVPNPFSSEPGARLYRTGDLGRFLPDENIEFTGRVDHQVKVRGFRIDLGDIETTLRQHDAVREAVVLNREYAGGDQRLVAYLVAKKPAPAEEGPEVRAGHDQLIEGAKLFLKEKLPEYMVPNAFVILKQLPLNPNGKVDRGALPDPETYTPGINARVEAPRTPLEENLVEIFSEFLKLEPLGIDENFFEKGGHSLLATQVISRVNEIFQVKLNQVDFLVDPTVSGLARRIEDNRQASQDEPGENQ